jgi:hypothetical protein
MGKMYGDGMRQQPSLLLGSPSDAMSLTAVEFKFNSIEISKFSSL